jgi:putative ABC transport system permease protein
MTESILLCLLGGIAGILIAISGKNVVVGLAPGDLPRLDMVSIDISAFGFTFLIAVLAGVVCGIVPALRASGTDLTIALKQSAPGPSLHGRNLLASILIAGQIAMALVLLIASGLMLRTYIRLQAVPLNFDAKNILIINATPPYFKPEFRNGGLANRVKYSESLLVQVKKISGVECAALGELPIGTETPRFGFYGGMQRLFPEGQETRNLLFNAISTSPEFFEVIRARLLAGRLPRSDAPSDTGPSAVVNETFAHQVWPDTSPVGKKLILKQSGKRESIEVVGLIADIRTAGLEIDPGPRAYIPLAQSPGLFSGSLLVRSTIDPLTLVPLLRKALITVDKDAALGKIEILEQVLDSHYAARRFNLFIITLFGVLAFSLAVIGIFGTIAHSVSRRTHEIGIRMALGAQRGSVLALVVRQGLWMLVAGESIGLAGALALNKLLSSMVFGIATTDMTTYIAVSLTWAGTALFACFLPAYRATKIDPLITLRCE